MKFWLDAQLPPSLAKWLTETFGIEAAALRDLGLRDASDKEIFDAARQAGATVITKDSDFADLLFRLGAAPTIVWITCGNASNAHMKQLLEATFHDTLKLLEAGEAMVEIAEK
jgi:predicted nuclease of predicted toxin-antitoxin system